MSQTVRIRLQRGTLVGAADWHRLRDLGNHLFGEPRPPAHRSVSNSLSGRHWELDQVPAVGDRTDIVQLGTGHHVSAGEGQRRVALQRRVAAYLCCRRPDARRQVVG